MRVETGAVEVQVITVDLGDGRHLTIRQDGEITVNDNELTVYKFTLPTSAEVCARCDAYALALSGPRSSAVLSGEERGMERTHHGNFAIGAIHLHH